MNSKSTIPMTKAVTTSEPAKDNAPILRLPVELRDIIYSIATNHEPWPRLNPKDRPCSRLATLAPRQRAILTTERNDSGEPQLICAHQLSRANKQFRSELSEFLRTSSMPIVSRMRDFDFSHIQRFLSTLEEVHQDTFKLRHDGSADRKLTIELQGLYTRFCMENLHRWIEYVDAFVGSEKLAELGALYKILDSGNPKHATTLMDIPPSRPFRED